jgi:8-oxo-dGTP pyrophosphatase MutT (NUDIX family)
METEKGVIIVAYKEKRRNQRYAVLQRTKNWEGWELPKGHLEKNDYQETVKIELKEETGIEEAEIDDIKGLEETVNWEYKEDGDKFRKEYKGFIVKLDEEVEIDTSQNPCNEHSQGFFLNKEDAKGLLTYENQQKLLEKASKNL